MANELEFHISATYHWYRYVINGKIKYKIIVIFCKISFSLETDLEAHNLFKILINKTRQSIQSQSTINVEVKHLESIDRNIIFGYECGNESK